MLWLIGLFADLFKGFIFFVVLSAIQTLMHSVDFGPSTLQAAIKMGDTDIYGIAYQNIIKPLAVALLLLNVTYHLYKSLFTKDESEAEDPVRTCFTMLPALFFVAYVDAIVLKLTSIFNAMADWVDETLDLGKAFDLSTLKSNMNTFGEQGAHFALNYAIDVVAIATGLEVFLVMGIILIDILLISEFVKVMVMYYQRYVSMSLGYFLAPMSFAAMPVSATKDITKTYWKQQISQSIAFLLSRIFIVFFCSLFAQAIVWNSTEAIYLYIFKVFLVKAISEFYLQFDHWLDKIGLTNGMMHRPSMAMDQAVGRELGRGLFGGGGGGGGAAAAGAAAGAGGIAGALASGGVMGAGMMAYQKASNKLTSMASGGAKTRVGKVGAMVSPARMGALGKRGLNKMAGSSNGLASGVGKMLGGNPALNSNPIGDMAEKSGDTLASGLEGTKSSEDFTGENEDAGMNGIAGLGQETIDTNNFGPKKGFNEAMSDKLDNYNFESGDVAGSITMNDGTKMDATFGRADNGDLIARTTSGEEYNCTGKGDNNAKHGGVAAATLGVDNSTMSNFKNFKYASGDPEHGTLNFTAVDKVSGATHNVRAINVSSAHARDKGVKSYNTSNGMRYVKFEDLGSVGISQSGKSEKK